MRKIAFDPKKETAVASGGGDCNYIKTYIQLCNIWYHIYVYIYTYTYISYLIYTMYMNDYYKSIIIRPPNIHPYSQSLKKEKFGWRVKRSHGKRFSPGRLSDSNMMVLPVAALLSIVFSCSVVVGKLSKKQKQLQEIPILLPGTTNKVPCFCGCSNKVPCFCGWTW